MLTFDLAYFAVCLRTKRGKRSLREVAAEISTVSVSTLSRIDNGKPPDLETFLRLCDWLDMSPQSFFSEVAEECSPELTAPARIELSLHADPTLSQEAITAVLLLLHVLRTS